MHLFHKTNHTLFLLVQGYGLQGRERNYYSVLEVSRHSTAMEIRQAYKKVSKKLHPDKNPSQNAEAMFQQVKVAYDVSPTNICIDDLI